MSISSGNLQDLANRVWTAGTQYKHSFVSGELTLAKFSNRHVLFHNSSITEHSDEELEILYNSLKPSLC